MKQTLSVFAQTDHGSERVCNAAGATRVFMKLHEENSIKE